FRSKNLSLDLFGNSLESLLKSHSRRPFLLIVKCWVKGCTWRVRATSLRDYPKFHVRVFVLEHTCSFTKRYARARQAIHDILGVLYKDFVGGVGPKVLPMHVAKAMNNDFKSRWRMGRLIES
ncbi:unnamed protein product, partial [Arabidopsis halleri]